MGTPGYLKIEKSPGLFSAARNEDGVALITVLIVLLLLAILGATVLTSSTSELKIVGNYRNMQNAFFTTDAAVEFAVTNGSIYTALIPGTMESWPKAGEGVVLDANGNPTATESSDPNYNEIAIGGGTAKIKVDYIESGAVPPGSGSEVDVGLGSGTGFKANYFTVDVIGSTQANNAQVEIESHIARIIPK